MPEALDDLFYELLATGWQMHGFYERGPARPGLVGDELIKHWNCRLLHSHSLFAHGTGDTPAEALRNAITDTARAVAERAQPAIRSSVIPRRVIKGTLVHVNLEDLGL